MNVAVVGHSEWVTFARVARIPRPGDILHAPEHWTEAAGGGAVASAELARLAGKAHFFTVIGNDAPARWLVESVQRHQVQVHAARREEPHPLAFTFLEPNGERTITVLGAGLKPRQQDALPWELLADMDAVYFASGDVAALKLARRAKVLVATARILPILAESGVELDVLVHSAADEGERYEDGMLPVRPRLVVTTQGSHGGRYRFSEGQEGRYAAVPLPGPVADAYGAGDSFAAGLTYGWGRGLPISEALTLAARSGANAFCRRGALG